MPIPLIDELVSHPVRAYRNGSFAWISDLKIVLIPCFTFLKYNSFELWSAWYSNNTNKSLFSLVSVIRHFKELLTRNFVISMSVSSYKWNALNSGFLSSVSITLITRCLLAVFLRNASFLPWNKMPNRISGCYQLWLDSLGSHKILQSCILPPDVFLSKK